MRGVMSDSFSIVKIGGSQYKVSIGDVFKIEQVKGKAGDKLTFDKVYLIYSKGKVSVGKPIVRGAKVEAKIIDQIKGEKIKILKYKAKSRYRRKIGHRQRYTRIEITKV